MSNDTLKLKRPMMHGPAVVRVQEMLDTLGFDGGPNDGVYGPMTDRMVANFQEKYRLRVDGICGPKTWAAIISATDEKAKAENSFIEPDYITTDIGHLVDRRDLHPRPKLYKCKRPWSQIVGVTLHQTGCNMPQNPAGWDRLNAHIGITQEGVAILVNDPTDFIWHAQGLSKNTIGIEIEGNYYGIDGDERTLWKGGGGPHHLNPEMLKALEDVRMWLVEQFAFHGSRLQYLYAHRQSAKSRIGDPGEEIWKSVALPWSEKTKGLGTYPVNKVGTGRQIPKEWDDVVYCDYFCAPGSKW